MLPRINRLPAFEIPPVTKHGKRVVGNGITLIYRKDPSTALGIPLAKSRFTFIVSTKVDKRATVRNRVRRLMSESVRHLMPTIPSSIDAVFIGSKLLVGLSQVQIELIVQDLLQRAGLLFA